jgi:hypothetical protein
MPRKWKPGDPVTVTTVNGGLPVIRKRAVEAWHGVVVGPSLVGPGWWNVRQLSPKRSGRGGVYAVPAGEIKPRKR